MVEFSLCRTRVQNAVPAHDRGFLLKDSRVAQFQGPLGQSAWALNGYFLAAQDPVVTFSQSRPEKEGPRRRSISICDSRPVAESYILPLYNHSRHLKIRRRPVSAIGGFEPFGFDLCGVASFVADTANGPWEFVGNSLVQIENHYFRHGAWLKIGDISNAHRVGDTLLRKCRPASNRGHENAQ
jgi:hypothetical protein